MEKMKRKLKGCIKLGWRDENIPQIHWQEADDSFSFFGKKVILHFPGDGATDAQKSNGSIKCILKTLQSVEMSNVDFVSAYYDTVSSTATHRVQQLKEIGELKDSLASWPEPEHVLEAYYLSFFETFFAPLVSDQNKQRLPLQQAKKNMQNLMIIGHCHGTVVAFEMERLLQKYMEKLGYTVSERADIQRQLVIIACTSRIPVGVSQSSVLHITSFSDPQKGRNWKAENFHEFLNNQNAQEQNSILVAWNNHEMILSADRLLQYSTIDEHDFRAYFDTQDATFEKSFTGKKIVHILRSFIGRMAHAEERPALPSVFQQLPEQSFLKTLLLNGQNLKNKYNSYLETCHLSRTAVFDCIEKEDLNTLKQLIQEKKVMLGLRNEAGDFPIHAALRTKNKELISAVIPRARLWFQTVNGQGETPLFQVLKQGQFKMAHFLWEKMENTQLGVFDKYYPLREIQRKTVLWTIHNLHRTPIAVHFLGTLLTERSLRIKPEDMLLVVQNYSALQKREPFPHQEMAVKALNYFICRFIKESHETELFQPISLDRALPGKVKTLADRLTETLKEDVFQQLLLKRRESYCKNNRGHFYKAASREII